METIAVWFSCGAASAVAAKKTIEQYSDKFLIRVLNAAFFVKNALKQKETE